MTNFLKLLLLLTGLSLVLFSCDDDDSGTDVVDQLAGTSWVESFSRTTGCDDDTENGEVRCADADCIMVTFEENRLIQTGGGFIDEVTFSYTKIDANTIEICFIDCSQGDIEIDGDKLIITSGPDTDGCSYYTEYTRL